ncbi:MULTISPECIES: hypothetical protein [Haloprofundus]|uniref:hypothetical protein n=1 Tax=Haloprofundus TaxID=1911573 RepID=UPI000E43F83E|nr:MULTISPECIES: hypothetical protein [Haloprofundus]QCJ47982.1 hypothetical protein FCF25_13030 [Haloprofundus sp. MHR1]
MSDRPRGEPYRYTGPCPVDGCDEQFVAVGVPNLRQHVREVHGPLAVHEQVPELELVSGTDAQRRHRERK